MVLIVGAGPTGLNAALWLQRKGVPFRLVDKTSAAGTTSRAIAVQARTLEFYRQLGISARIVEAGVIVREIRLFRKGKRVAIAQVGDIGTGLTPFDHLLFLSQDQHEKLLIAELEAGGAKVERQTELLSIDQDESGAACVIRSPAGTERATFSYVIGADGARSTVRHAMGIDFPGGTYEQVFYVADTLAEGEMNTGALQISVSREDFCIVMPLKESRTTRLIGIVPPAAESKDKIGFEDVAGAVDRNTGLKINKVNWFSSYHVHHRIANQFRRGRVFLAGDAGHIHSPAGGQGMNTGIGDAVNLAWKLADVIQGRMPEKILESYEEERMAFARTLVATTDQGFRLIAGRGPLGSLFRAYVMPRLFALLTRFKPTLRMLFGVISQLRINYRGGSLSGPLDDEMGAAQPGDRLPFVRFEGGRDNHEPLASLNWQYHIYGLPGGDAPEKDIPVHKFPFNEEAQAKGLSEGVLYLVRPDGHLARSTPGYFRG